MKSGKLILMKKLLFLIAAWLMVNGGLSNIFAQNRADRQKLNDPESFTIVVFGDVQNYTKNSTYQPIY